MGQSTICYLVLAHTDSEHFGHLIGALSPHAPVVAHVDRKVDIDPFQTDGATLLEDRVSVNWVGFSVVDATLRLLRTARSLHPEVGRYCLISGDSYPLRPPAEINAYFAEAGDAEFINLLPMPAPQVNKPLTRLSHYWHEHDPRSDRLTKLYIAAHKLLPQPWRKALNGRTPFCGSKWFALTVETVDDILAQVDDEPGYVRLMRHTCCPDEHFFHTLIGNIAAKTRLRPSFMFVDFDVPPPGPAILDAGYASRLRPLTMDSAYGHHELLFARKFRTGISDELRHEIDQSSRPSGSGGQL